LHFPLKIFIVLFGFLHLIDIDWDLRFFIYFLLKLRDFSLLSFLKFEVLSFTDNLKYFFLFFIYILRYVYFSKHFLKNRNFFILLIKRLIFVYINTIGLFDFFVCFKLFLEECLNVLFGSCSPLIRFVLITIDKITASFLARYLAKKLSYGFTIKELLLPIKRELLKFISHSGFFFKQKINVLNSLDSQTQKLKIVFKFFIFSLFSFLFFILNRIYTYIFF